MPTVHDIQKLFAQTKRHYAEAIAAGTFALEMDEQGIHAHRYIVGEIKGIDEQAGTITHYISTPRIDYVRDVMNPFGANTEALEKNRSVFWNHQTDELPIGKCMSIVKQKDGVLCVTKYAKDVYPFAADVFNLTVDKYLNSFSIGYRMLDFTYLSIADLRTLIAAMPTNVRFIIPNMNEYDDDERVCYNAGWGCHEYSEVGVPMNMDATIKGMLQKALASGTVKTEEMKKYLGSKIGRMDLGDITITEKGIAPVDAEKLAILIASVKSIGIEVGGLKESVTALRAVKQDSILQAMNGKLDQVVALCSAICDAIMPGDAPPADDGDPADEVVLEDGHNGGSGKLVQFDPSKMIESAVQASKKSS